MPRFDGNTVSLEDARAATLADLSEDIRAELARGARLAWHAGHLAAVARYGQTYWCFACGDTTVGSQRVMLPTPPA